LESNAVILPEVYEQAIRAQQTNDEIMQNVGEQNYE
jgi:hypothetical protein